MGIMAVYNSYEP